MGTSLLHMPGRLPLRVFFRFRGGRRPSHEEHDNVVFGSPALGGARDCAARADKETIAASTAARSPSLLKSAAPLSDLTCVPPRFEIEVGRPVASLR